MDCALRPPPQHPTFHERSVEKKSSHILEYFTPQSLPENAEKTCILCGEESQRVLCRCSKCNFSICIYCERNPPPLTVEHTKTHKHKLSLLARRVSFTCNVCGMEGDRSPYTCIQCSFLVHQENASTCLASLTSTATITASLSLII